MKVVYDRKFSLFIFSVNFHCYV